MTRLALISFGAPVLALAALAGLDAFTAPRVSQGRLGATVNSRAHASMTADCGCGLLGAK